MLNKQAKRLFTYAIYITSANIGIPIFCLNKNADEEVEKILSKIFPLKSKIFLRKIEDYAKKGSISLKEFYNEDEKDLFLLLSPLELSSSEFHKQIEKDITSALWFTNFTFPNPFYFALKGYFKYVKSIIRFHYLILIKYYKKNKRFPDKIINPLGFTEKIKCLNEEIFLIYGFVWGKENLKHFLNRINNETNLYNLTYDMLMEKVAGKTVKTLEEIENKNLPFENKSYILNTLRMHPLMHEEELNEKAIFSSEALNKLFNFYNNYKDFIKDLHISEWRTLVQWFVFAHNPIINIFIKYNFEHIKKESLFKKFLKKFFKKYSKESFYFSLSLSERKDRKNETEIITIFTFNPNNSTNVEIDIKPKIHNSNKYDETIDDELNKKLLNKFLQFKTLTHINKSHFERILFNRLRNELEQLPFNESQKRCEEILKIARMLVFADKATYCIYDSIEDKLIPENMIREWTLQKKNISEEEKEKSEAKKILEEKLNEWSKNIVERKKSALYRAIDGPCIVSRFDKKNILFNPEISEVIEQQVIEHSWFKDEDDIIAIPVLFSGRKQGVLYVAVSPKAQFLLQDRLRLLTFVKNFEAEIFEARLLEALSKINNLLGKALFEEKIDENEFCDNICIQIAKLIGAAGVTLWWKSTLEGSMFELKGRAGKKINEIIEKKAYLQRIDPLIKDTINKKSIIKINQLEKKGSYGKIFFDAGLKGCIIVPIINEEKNIFGIIFVHDKDEEMEISTSFIEEMKFLSGEIRQILLHFFEHKGRIENLKTYFAHDFDSHLRAIQSAKNTLSEFYSKFIPSDYKHNYKKRLDDIDKYVMLCHDFIDIFTKGKIRRSTNLKGRDPLLEFIDHLKFNISEPCNLRKTVLAVLHANEKDMKGKQIKFDLDWPSDKNIKIWINDVLFQNVLNNIIDNIKKYGKPGHTYKVGFIEKPSEFRIFIETIGIPLDNFAQKNPFIIFQDNTHCVPKNKGNYKGEGKGFYVAKMITKSWAGDIELKYTLNKNWATYRFEISFPRYLAKEKNPWKE